MARHRHSEDQPDPDSTPEMLAGGEAETQVFAAVEAVPDELGSPARVRMSRRTMVLAVVGVVLIAGCSFWVLARPPDPMRLLLPLPGVSQQTGGRPVIEGFGEASAQASASPTERAGGPRVPPGASQQPTSGEPSVAPAAGPLPPLAQYRFNESSGGTAADATGGGRTATLAGGAVFVPGRTGNAVDLSGSGQYVSLPSGILSGATDFTIAAWVRLDAANTWARVFDFGSSTSVNMFLTVRSDTGSARFAITTGGNGAEQRINAPAPLPAGGAWTHVAVTLSGGVGILYVNRAEAARTTKMTLTPSSLGGTSRNWIGRSQYSADPYLNGSVDDLRIYTRALSASEIAELP